MGESHRRPVDPADGAENAAWKADLAGGLAFVGPHAATTFQENRRQVLRWHDLTGDAVYEEVLERGGVLASLPAGRLLLSECLPDRCAALWRYSTQ